MNFAGKILAILILLTLASPGLTQDDKLYGKTLEEALRVFQRKGVNVLYSSDLVQPDMMVYREPETTDPRKAIEAILAAHGLRLLRGPASTLLVVRGSVPIKFQTNRSEKSTNGFGLDEFLVVPFVNVYLTAQDSHDQFVTNLKASDFVVKENGRTQSIVEFLNSGIAGQTGGVEDPLTVLLLLDSSHSMNIDYGNGKRHDVIKHAASYLLNHLEPEARVLIMGFNTESWTISGVTQDMGLARNRLMEQQIAGGRTAVFDAIMAGLRNIQEFSGRKIIVLCSDGQDNSSVTPLKEVTHTLESSDVTLFALGTYFNDRISKEARETLNKIAEVTGGYAFFSSNLKELLDRAAKVGRAMRSQYILGYHPPQPSLRGWRRIQVQCKNPAVRLRYRKAYLF